MSKTKKSLLSGLVALILMLALSVSALAALPARADDEGFTADQLVSGGTAYVPVEKTREDSKKGKLAYESVTLPSVPSANFNANKGPFSGVQLTSYGYTSFELGTYDFSSLKSDSAWIEFLPFTADLGQSDSFKSIPAYTGFTITFTSGDKSFKIKSYNTATTYNTDQVDRDELGIGVAGENQDHYAGWDFVTGKQVEATGANRSNILPQRIDGSSNNRASHYANETDKPGENAGSNTMRRASLIGIYVNNTDSDFWVYTNTARDAAAYRNFDNKETAEYVATCGKVGLTADGTVATESETETQYRYKVRNLTEENVLGDAAWTAFTGEELKNVSVTVELTGVTAESKFLVTKLAGNAVTQDMISTTTGEETTAHMQVMDNRLSDGVSLFASDGIARTLSDGDDTLTVNNKLYLADNTATEPLATIALFPSEYGSEKIEVIDSSNYTNGAKDEQYKIDTAKENAKNKADVEAVYFEFESDNGKYLAVKLGYRGVNDAAGLPVSYYAKTSKTGTDWYSLFVNNTRAGNQVNNPATRGASAIRFDGYVNSTNEFDENGVQQTKKGSLQDPVYSIYYDAKTNKLYTDTGRDAYKTGSKVPYRWEIADLNALEFTGFGGDDLVTMKVSVDLRDKGEGVEKKANVMIMNIDGYDVAYSDYDNVKLDVSKAPTSGVYALENKTAALAAATNTAQITVNSDLKVHNLFTGWTTYTGWTVKVTDPDGKEVTVTDNKFTANKLGDYKVKYMKDDSEIASYTVTTGYGFSADSIVEKFSKVGSNLSEVKDLCYDTLPSYMDFSGGAIMVETKNAASATAGSHFYTWGARGADGSGAAFNDAIDISSMSFTSAADHDFLVKLAFPHTEQKYASYLTAITYRINIYDATDASKFITIYIIPKIGGSCLKAIGSWEIQGIGALVRETPWSNDDGSLHGPVPNGNEYSWEAGKELAGFTTTKSDIAPLELSFDYATGRLYAIYGDTAMLVRDFVTSSPVAGSTFPGFTEGKVKLTVGVDMPNFRTPEGDSALYTRFAIMGLAGVDFTATDGFIADKAVASFGTSALAGDDVVFDKITLGTVFGGTSVVSTGKIKVALGTEEKLAETDYASTLKLNGSSVTAGTYTLTYINDVGKFDIPFVVEPAIKKASAAFDHVVVKLDGVDVTALPDKSSIAGRHTVTVTLDAGYQLKELNIGGIDYASSVKNGTLSYTYTNGTVATDVIDISAVAETITYNVNYTYDTTGATIVSTNATSTFTVEDSSITLPTFTVNATSDNDKRFAFDGWYYNGAKVTNGTFNFPAEDITLTAKVKEKVYTITLKYGESIADDVITFTYGNMSTMVNRNVIRGYGLEKAPAGKLFSDWYTDAECNNILDYSSFTPADTNTTLYAKWNNGIVVSFNSNGGSTVADQTIASGTALDFNGLTPTKEGYDFDGWYKNADLTTPVNNTDTYTANATLYAKWNVKLFTVTAIVNGASTDIERVAYGTKVSELTLPTLTEKANHTVSWSLGGDEIIKGNTTIVAVYTSNPVTVTFNSDGGSAVEAKVFAYGEAITAPADPTKEGYTFDGWYNGDTKYTFGAAAAADVTLTAKWTAIGTETPADQPSDDKEGCGKEAIGLLAVVMSALGATLIIKKRG